MTLDPLRAGSGGDPMTETDWMRASGEVADAVNRGEIDKVIARARLLAAGYTESEAHDIANVYFEHIDRAAALSLVEAKRVQATADCFFVVGGMIRKHDDLGMILNRAWDDGLVEFPTAEWPDGLSPVTLTTAGKAALAVELIQ